MTDSNQDFEHVSGSQLPSDRPDKGWYSSQPERDRKLFESMLFGLGAGLILFVFTLLKEPGDDAYYKANGALSIVFVFLLVIIRRRDLKEMLRNAWRSMTDFKSASLTQLTDFIFAVSMLLAVASVLFVIDASFLSNYGIRIGAVAAVGLIKMLRSTFVSFRK